MRKVIALYITIGMVVVSARADIIPSFTGTTISGPNTVWGYQIDITSEQIVTAGDFFTIYDFGPFVARSNSQPSNWSFSWSLVGPTPAGTNAPDNPNILNLTWTYTGSSALTGIGIGPFSVMTAGAQERPPTRDSFFAAQGTRGSGPDAGTKVNNVGRIPVPAPIPEPSSVALIGLGALSWAIARRRRR
jgi:PEP-CTERM motif-containing protein